MKHNRVLAAKYNESLERMEKDLNNLDKQVTKLTSGDLRIAKRRDGKIQFDPKRNAKSLETYGKYDDGINSAEESEEEKRELFTQCFSKNNRALGMMTRTIDNINQKKNKRMGDLEKLLQRAHLDRPSMINEKFYCIWRDPPK